MWERARQMDPMWSSIVLEECLTFQILVILNIVRFYRGSVQTTPYSNENGGKPISFTCAHTAPL